MRKESRGEGEAGISLLGLTPGTPFMARVADSLAFYACQRLQQGSYQGVAFEVSGSTVPVSHLISHVSDPRAMHQEVTATCGGAAAEEFQTPANTGCRCAD